MSEDAPAGAAGGAAATGGADESIRIARPRAATDGWATVELDRAEADLATGAVAAGGATAESAADDELLGARCRRWRGPDGVDVLLLEPSTEGRLAGLLARHGEGRLVRYLDVDGLAVERLRAAGFTVSTEGRGPLGPERLVLLPVRELPQIVLTGFDRGAAPPFAARSAGTIRR